MTYQSPQPGWQPDPYGQPTPLLYGQAPPAMPSYGYGYPAAQPKKSYTGLVIGLVIAAVAIVFMVFVAPFIFIDRMTSNASDLLKDSTGGNTEKILADDLDVSFGIFERDPEYTSLKTGRLAVTFKNKSSEKATYHVQLEAVDSDGNRIAEDTAFVENLAPGQSVTEYAFKFTQDDYAKLTQATFKVAGVDKF